MTVARRTTYREVLASREFCAVLAAWLLSMLGTVVSHVALAVLVFARTGSPLLSALAFSIGWLPHLFVGALLSGLVDRVRPRRLLVGCDLLSAAVVAVMVVPGMPVAALLALVVLQGFVTPVFLTTRAATLPELLPGDAYVLGRSLLTLVAQGSQLVGFAAGGLLVAGLGARGALAVDAVSFLLSALVLRVGLADRPATRTATGGLARDSLAGLRALWRLRRVRALLLLGWLTPLLGVVPESVVVPFVREAGAGAGAVGLLFAAVAAGTVVGDLLVARLLRPDQRVRWMGPLALSSFVPMLPFVLSPAVGPAAVLLFLTGIGWGYLVAHGQLMLVALPEDLRGRGLAVSSSGAMLTQGVGFLLGGALAQVLAPQVVVAVGGVAGLVVTAWLLAALRRADAVSVPDAPAARGRAG